MEKLNEEEKLNGTCLYGSDVEKSKRYDVSDILKEKIFNYKITKIKCQLKSNEGIYGIQFFYRNLIDGKESILINIESKEKDLIEQEFDLNGESIIDMKTWLNENIILIGFEITTDKKRFMKFGYGNDEPIKTLDLKNLDKVIVGFGVCANEENNSIISIYAYYVNRGKYLYNMYKGILFLRRKSQNQIYKEKIKKKIQNMSRKNQILFRICNLPQNQFFNIIKYTQ